MQSTRLKSSKLLPSTSTPNSAHSQLSIILPSEMSMNIYAEHLINIRTLTIQASLPTNSDGSTTLSADGNILTLSHQGEAVKVSLPVSIPVSERVKISVPPVPSTNLSIRVRLDDTSPRDSQSSETVIPWTATSLSQQVQLQCKTCHAEILPRGNVQTWKDLPSEGWAEMMEFWHCHKPNEPDHEHQTDKKGYSADSTLAITPSVGLVNATSFVLATEDCKNIKVGHIAYSLFPQRTETMWALKRTGAFRPQGYHKWKIRDIAALEKDHFSQSARPAATPAKAVGSLAKQMLIVLANSSSRRRAHWRGVHQRIDT
jgi:hypothetical protein